MMTPVSHFSHTFHTYQTIYIMTITIYGTGTKQTKNYSLDPPDVSAIHKPKNLQSFHLFFGHCIDQTTTVFLSSRFIQSREHIKTSIRDAKESLRRRTKCHLWYTSFISFLCPRGKLALAYLEIRPARRDDVLIQSNCHRGNIAHVVCVL